MFKKIILLIVVIFVSGCGNKEVSNIKVEEDITSSNEVEEYIDDNNIKLGLFLYDGTYNNKHVIEDTYYTDFISGVDIGSFEVFLTDDKIINGSKFKDTWNKYYNTYENIEDYKVGFNIKFILKDGTSFNSNFLEPDIYKFSEYFYVYLYDDINQEDNSYYSHLETMNDNSILTSIKIYAVEGIDKVENIILSAFTYDSEDDFDDNNYRGNSIYVIRIKRNK